MSKRIESGERLTLHMSSVDSAVFSEAYFVLRQRGKSKKAPMENIVAEARRVIREYSERMPSPDAQVRKNERRAFASGVLAGVAACAVVIFLFAIFVK